MADDMLVPSEPLDAVLEQATRMNPDQYAKNMNLSRSSGLDVEIVSSDPAAIEREVRLQSIDRYGLRKSPATEAYLYDLAKASLSHDDIENLSGFERALTPLAAAAQAALATEEGALRVPKYLEDVATLTAQGVEKVGVPRAVNPIRALETLARGARYATDPYARKFQEARQVLPEIAAPFKRLGEVNAAGDEAVKSALNGDFKPLMTVLTDPEAVTTYGANALPSLLVALASGGSFTAVAAMEGGGELVEQADFAAKNGEIPLAQRVAATTQTAIISGMLEKAGVDYLRKFPAFKQFFKEADAAGVNVSDVLKAAVAEGGTEVLQQLNQNIAQKLTYDPTQELTSGMLQSLIGGAGAGGGIGAVGYVASVQYKKAETAAFDVKNSVNANEQAAIDKMNQYASQSMTRTRDKETFREFVQSIDKESRVYIDGEQAVKYMQEKTPEEIAADPALQLLKKGIDEAQVLGADIAIPVSDFATDVAGSEHFDALRQHMKVNPESSTPFRQAQAEQEARQYVQGLMTEAQKNVSQYAEAQDIFATVRDQLIDTGRMTQQQAGVMADIVPAWATVQAAHRGIPVSQVYAESGLTIEGPMTGKAAELSKAAMEQVIYHGTTPEAAAAIEAEGFDVKKSADGTVWFTSNKNIGEVAASGKGGIVARVLNESSLKLAGWDESDKFSTDELISQGYDGVKLEDEGETTYQIFHPEKLLKPVTFEQPAADLYVAHNLSADNLRHVAEIGGLAAPSLAVGRVGKGTFDSFGEITLLADKSMLESAKARTFDADVYTPRHPRAEYTIDRKKFEALTRKLKDETTEAGDLRMPSYDDLSRGPDDLLYSDALRYYFLKGKGKAPKPKTAKVAPWVKKAAALGLKGAYSIENSPEFEKMLRKHLESEVKRMKADPELAEATDSLASGWFNEDGTVKSYTLRDNAWKVARYIEDGGIDTTQMRADISKAFRSDALSKEFAAYARDTFNDIQTGARIFKGFTNSGDRRYADYTLENIVREMTQAVRGGESFNYGAGNLRAMYANEMKTVKQVQARREQIIDKESFAKIKEESQQKLFDAIDALRPFYKFDSNGFGYIDDASSAIGEGPKGWREAFELNDESRKIITDLVDYMRTLPTEYFETKVGRAVQLSEFDTAIVPKGADADVIKILTDAGLKVKKYKDNEDRARIISEQQNLLFQQARGYYDPSQSLIRLTEASNLSTFLHEFAHFMYDMEKKNPNSPFIEKIHQWFKRNAADVAQEANGYLGREGQPIEQPDYQGEHRPPGPRDGAPLDDLTGDGRIYPDDVYGPNGARYYGTGDDIDNESFSLAQSFKGRPDASVTIYRAVPDANADTKSRLKKLNSLVGYRNKFPFYPMGDEIIAELQDKYPSENFTYDEQQKKIAEDLDKQIQELESSLKARPSINAGDWVTINRQYAKDHGESALNGKYTIIKKTVKAKHIFTNGDSIHEWGYWPEGSDVYEQGRTFDPANPNILMQAAYHGSPYKFDKFSLEHMGKGEGAQAYGWGLYFAGNKEVAEFYKRTLGKGSLLLNGEPLANSENPYLKDIAEAVAFSASKYPGSSFTIEDMRALVNAARPKLGSDLDTAEYEKQKELLLGKTETGELTGGAGQLYKVEIPEDDTYLLWDKPLSEQSEKVKAALYASGYTTDADEMTGRELYQDTSDSLAGGPETENPDELTSKQFHSLGINGIKYLDGSSRAKGEGAYNYVIFDDNAIQIVETYYQGQMIDKAEGPITAADVVSYLDNRTSGDAAKDAAIERAVHEQFARGFETYLMEGKAPSIELRNVFRTFARWLTQVYKAIKGDLQVNLDDEMRQVFDRMIATDEQIAAAEARTHFAPMFTDAAMTGMTDEEYTEYKKKQEKVRDKATETLRDKLIKQLTRQTEAWWKEEKADLVSLEIERLKGERVYAAIEALRNGQFKLDTALVKEKYSEVRTDKLGRKMTHVVAALTGMTASGGAGVNPDDAAAFLGYGSGDEMIQDIIAAPKIKDVAEQNAQQQMLDKHGDILTDGTIEREADEAMQNEERGKLILDELKALSRGTNRAVLDRIVLKSLAEENIGKLSFREIQPGKYRAAELRAAQEAAAMLAAGNKEGAATAKARQALNYYLGMAATEAKNDTMKIVDRMARYKKKEVREAIAKAGNGYLEQLDKVLYRFEFRKSATMSQVDALNENIQAWMKARIEEDGDALVLSAAVMDEGYKKHWKNVPYSELVGISDSVKNIEHVARYSNKITRMQEELDFQQLVQKWSDSMNEKASDKFVSQRTTVADGRNWGRWAMAQMTKVPYLASWLDGGERAGLSHSILVQPFTDAYDKEVRMWGEVGKVVMGAIENRSKEDIKRHNQKVFIPEIKDGANDGNLYGHQIIAVALNTGNAGNLKKMLCGEGWANPDNDTEITFDNPKLQAVLKHMTRSDWELVQLIWDQMDKLYPELAEVHRRTTGLTPPKVEAVPFKVTLPRAAGEVSIGEPETIEMRGGYYPVKYDPNRSFKAEMNEDKLNAQTDSMFSSMGIQASVTASSINERTKYFAPIRLSLDVVPSHFQETIHYITHHDAVRETNKLLRNPTIAATIKAKLGPEEYAQLKPWLNDIAKDGREAPMKTYWGTILQRLRFGLTLGVMGFKASTGLMQLLGLSNTVAEVGSANVYQAVRSILGSTDDMKRAWEFAAENSKVMSHRTETMDREIKNAMQRIEGKRGFMAAVQEASMKHIAYIQTYIVDLPSWHAAYIKGMKEWGDEKRAYQYADWVVENIQGSGVTKDMAAIMRNQSQEARMFTMFMTFFSSLWNLERDLVRGTASGYYSKTTVAAKIMFIFTLPVFIEMLMRGEFGDDDDDESVMQKYLTKTAMYPVQSVPFARDVAAGVFGEYGYNISPIAQLIEQGTVHVPKLVTAPFTDEEITKSNVKGATKFIGAAVGVPGVAQAWATGEHLNQVISDGEELTVKELLYGPNRK